ncbi:MAG: HNH endonuclease [Saprospiraceae bacterium]|nr:HNH endonuclease [Saprospiraceae bacterium]
MDEDILQKLFDDLPTIRSFLDEGVDRVRAWEKLASLGDTPARIWMRRQTQLLERMVAKKSQFPMENLKKYYNRHRSNGDINTYPGTSTTGQYYDEFGHPDFTQSVKKIRKSNGTDLGRASYEPQNGITGNRTTDAGNANVWASQNFHPDDFKYTPGSNECKIKDPTSLYADSEGFVTHTWQHHQDGKTMMAVPSHIHSSSNASHIGGVQAKEEGIIGFFDSPNYTN